MPVLDENDCQEVMMDFDDLKVTESQSSIEAKKSF